MNKQNLREYWKFNFFTVFFGFGGSVWGGLTFFIGIPVAYLTYLDASSMQIGLITAIFWAGFALPQIWAAYVSEAKLIKKYFLAAVWISSSITWLIIGVYILLTGASDKDLSIWLFLLLFAWACSLTGMYWPAVFSMIFKIIPTPKLGKLIGLWMAVQYGALFVSGPFIKKINIKFAQPVNYAVLFLLTFIITVFSTVILLWVKEPEGEELKASPDFISYLKKCVNIIKTDKHFTRFIVGKWLMTGHYIMLAFLMAYLIKERGFDPLNSGWLTSLNGLGLCIGGLTIVKIADIYGPKYMLLTSHILVVIYTIIAWLVPSTGSGIFYAAFVITGLAQISDNIGYSNMTMLLCPTLDKSTYGAVVNVGVNMLTIPLPIIFGILMDKGILNYNGTFTIAISMMVAAIIYILVVIKNPKAFIEMKASYQG
ncbi:MFS transporter [Candidatus Latescibacterota bacterium]